MSNQFPNIKVYFDETNLLGGFIQVAFVLPEDKYINKFEPKAKSLLEKIDKRAKEFKANKFDRNSKHSKRYEDFLDLIRITITSSFDKTGLNSIIAIDSDNFYSPTYLQHYLKTLKTMISSISPANTFSQHFINESAKQYYWLMNHVNKIIQIKTANKFELIFDEKHNYAQQCLQSGVLLSGKHRVVCQNHDILKYLFNAQMKVLLRGKLYPIADKFTFFFSQKDFGLQAADVLSNFTFNFLKVENGEKDLNSVAKHDMLLNIIPELKNYPQLKAATKYAGNNILVMNNKLLSTITLN